MNTDAAPPKGTCLNAACGCGRKAESIATAAVVGLALAASAARAGLIDDFEGMTPKWSGVNNPSGLAKFEMVDQTLRLGANFTTATDPTDPVKNFANVYYNANLPVREGRKLELRAELVSVSHNDLFAYLGTVSANGGEYAVFKDRDEIGLLKWAAASGFSLAFWETKPIKHQSVVLVLTLTPIPAGLVVGTEVWDKGTGQVLYERAVLDTPASDWEVPDPLPHGWRIFHRDVGRAYADDLTVVWLAMLHHTDGKQGLAEVRFDNLEAMTGASPYLEIERAVICSWQENTVEGQIAVTADSVAGPWMPSIEPIVRRGGQLCVVAETGEAARYFKLVRGAQFVDGFDPLVEPFVSRNDWVPWFRNPEDGSRFSFVIADGALRIETTTTPVEGQIALLPPGGGAVYGDFCATVDILDWGGSGMSALGIAGRIQGGVEGISNTYLGSVRMDPVTSKGQLWFFDGGSDVSAAGPFDLHPGADYRLQFSGVGNRLNVRLLNVAEPRKELASGHIQDSKFNQGRVGLWINTRGTSGYRRAVDNFVVTGTGR